MFTGKILEQLCNHLASRNAFLYHACQLQDFYSYLSLGGIASRETIQKQGLPLTGFETDTSDKQKGLWNLVFGNFSDFGMTYHFGGKAVPNPYGPILIKIDWKAILEAQDCSVTLRSAGAKDFDRVVESLTTIGDVNNLFLYDIGNPKSNYLKYKKQLEADFGGKKIGSSPEWSMTFSNGVLPIEHFVKIIVDPIQIEKFALIDEVRRLSGNYDKILGELVVRGKCNADLNRLSQTVFDGASDLVSVGRKDSSLNGWVASISALDWQFQRYAKYLKDGTLTKIGKLSPPKAS